MPTLKAKYGLKLIGEQQPSGWLEGPESELRGHGDGPGALRQPGKGGRERCQDRRDEQAVLIWRVSRRDLARAGRP